jgi:hypothetical protein
MQRWLRRTIAEMRAHHAEGPCLVTDVTSLRAVVASDDRCGSKSQDQPALRLLSLGFVRRLSTEQHTLAVEATTAP